MPVKAMTTKVVTRLEKVIKNIKDRVMLEETGGLASLTRDPTPVPVTVAASVSENSKKNSPMESGKVHGPGPKTHILSNSNLVAVCAGETGSVGVGVPVVAASPMVTSPMTNPVLAAAAEAAAGAAKGFDALGAGSLIKEKVEFDDYETLPVNSVTAHMMAGALAGIMEHCVMYPLDSVKTRMQSLQPQPGGVYRNVMEALFRMVQTEGIFRPVRGMSVVVAGAGPAHAAYFSCYERIKESLVTKTPSHYNHIAHGVAGSVATVLHDGVMTPADVVKQRMQMYNSPYSSVWSCIRKTYHTEGLRAFYRSYTTQLTMNVPFQSIHFMVYEWMQGITNQERTYNPKAHMISGAMAGALAAAVTTPLDVCKTLLNTQESTALHSVGQSQISGLGHAFRTVYRLGGVKGYFQGATARVLYQMPSTAICWTVYEFCKYAIQSRG